MVALVKLNFKYPEEFAKGARRFRNAHEVKLKLKSQKACPVLRYEVMVKIAAYLLMNCSYISSTRSVIFWRNSLVLVRLRKSIFLTPFGP